MSAVKMSDAAFKDFRQLLVDNNVPDNVVRVRLEGMG